MSLECKKRMNRQKEKEEKKRVKESSGPVQEGMRRTRTEERIKES